MHIYLVGQGNQFVPVPLPTSLFRVCKQFKALVKLHGLVGFLSIGCSLRGFHICARKPVFGVFANNKGTDLISTFVIAYWKVLYLHLLQAKSQFPS